MQKKKRSASADSSGKNYKGFTKEELAAMKERVQELREGAHNGPQAGKTTGEVAVLAKIKTMEEPDRIMGRRLHTIIRASAPHLLPRLWYGMPAYADNEKIVCFFQPAGKFKTRYATLGFTDNARLDEGSMWPTTFALKRLTSVEEAKIAALVKRAVS